MSIIDAIDKALDDYAVSEDAMRWTPADVAAEFTACGCSFCVAGGIDLFSRVRSGSSWPMVAWAARTVRGAALSGVRDEWVRMTPAPRLELDDGSPSDPRARALWLRRHRNTGPAATVGLDGRRRR